MGRGELGMAVQGTHGHSLLTMDMGWLNPKINDLCPKAVNTHERGGSIRVLLAVTTSRV